ncbi:MAG: tetraacyldisaccharide 4'-kinase [Acidobacteria bacterium]|nr:tetraacyldisaccharide 4'-kinase [Acidobacteriota bacterium]
MRSPWQQFYGWAHAQRRRYWATRSESLARPVVSIGNLHWGGSGKTPTVIAAARGLQAGGRRVAVLSRGYRRRGRTPLLVSLGDGPLATVHQAGDEPVMIAEQAPGVVVAVGADRRAAAALTLDREPGIDVFLLDDGFSHLRVRRDVEVLTFPADDPFAGGLLLPGGRLREPLGMARLADAAVITGLEAGAEPPADFRSILRRHGFAGRVFASLLWAELAGGPPPDRPLLATGVARAERVARTAATAGLEVVRHLRFRDHHGYPPRSLRAIEAACVRHRCDAVVTTSKDAVKLRGRLPVGVPQLLELRIEARLAPEFLPWLSDRLER